MQSSIQLQYWSVLLLPAFSGVEPRVGYGETSESSPQCTCPCTSCGTESIELFTVKDWKWTKLLIDEDVGKRPAKTDGIGEGKVFTKEVPELESNLDTLQFTDEDTLQSGENSPSRNKSSSTCNDSTDEDITQSGSDQSGCSNVDSGSMPDANQPSGSWTETMRIANMEAADRLLGINKISPATRRTDGSLSSTYEYKNGKPNMDSMPYGNHQVEQSVESEETPVSSPQCQKCCCQCASCDIDQSNKLFVVNDGKLIELLIETDGEKRPPKKDNSKKNNVITQGSETEEPYVKSNSDSLLYTDEDTVQAAGGNSVPSHNKISSACKDSTGESITQGASECSGSDGGLLPGASQPSGNWDEGMSDGPMETADLLRVNKIKSATRNSGSLSSKYVYKSSKSSMASMPNGNSQVESEKTSSPQCKKCCCPCASCGIDQTNKWFIVKDWELIKILISKDVGKRPSEIGESYETFIELMNIYNAKKDLEINSIPDSLIFTDENTSTGMGKYNIWDKPLVGGTSHPYHNTPTHEYNSNKSIWDDTNPSSSTYERNSSESYLNNNPDGGNSNIDSGLVPSVSFPEDTSNPETASETEASPSSSTYEYNSNESNLNNNPGGGNNDIDSSLVSSVSFPEDTNSPETASETESSPSGSIYEYYSNSATKEIDEPSTNSGSDNNPLSPPFDRPLSSEFNSSSTEEIDEPSINIRSNPISPPFNRPLSPELNISSTDEIDKPSINSGSDHNPHSPPFDRPLSPEFNNKTSIDENLLLTNEGKDNTYSSGALQGPLYQPTNGQFPFNIVVANPILPMNTVNHPPCKHGCANPFPPTNIFNHPPCKHGCANPFPPTNIFNHSPCKHGCTNPIPPMNTFNHPPCKGPCPNPIFPTNTFNRPPCKHCTNPIPTNTLVEEKFPGFIHGFHKHNTAFFARSLNHLDNSQDKHPEGDLNHQVRTGPELKQERDPYSVSGYSQPRTSTKG